MSSVLRGGEQAVAGGDGVLTGNTFDKYGSRNPVVRGLMAGFERALGDLFALAAPASVLDVGCGEGVLTEGWAERLGSGRVVGMDLLDPKLEAEWARRRQPNLEFRSFAAGALPFTAGALPFTAGEFDLVAAIEVLEHLDDPQRMLAEMARVAGRHLLVSVPREPLWRALNIARGAYVRAVGNTPGHRNHWSRSTFLRLLDPYGDVVEARAPLPWTMVLVRVP